MKTVFDSRENNLDFVRLSLAVLVIFSHSFPLGNRTEHLEPVVRLTHGQSTAGVIAVDAFFIISGFLITNSFLRSRSVWDYFRKRIARIYPGFLACMLVCALIVAPLAGAASPYEHLVPRIVNFLGRALCLQEFSYNHAFLGNPSNSLNGSIWSISYEFGCYIAIALLGMVGFLRKRHLIQSFFCASLILVLAISLLVKVWAPGGPFWDHILGHRYFWERVLLRSPLIPMYLSGVVFYLYRDRIRHSTLWAVIALCVLAVSCFLPFSWQTCFPVAGTYLTFWFAFHPRVRLHHFARFGDFSYGTYLYAFPIQQLIVRWIGRPVNPYLLFLFAMPVSLLTAVLSWHAVEKWFLSPRRKHGEDAPILPSRISGISETGETGSLLAPPRSVRS